MTHLRDRVVVVTGAGSGFGRLLVRQAAARGARVVGTDVDPDALQATFEGHPDPAATAWRAADVTDLAQLRAVVQLAVERFGAVDVLVNNAGVMPLAFFADHARAVEAWHRAIDVNVKGVLNGIVAVYDQMIAQGRGHVVNISSIAGNAGIAGAGVYCATKAAVGVLSDALRVETKGAIKVTTVRPTGVPGTGLGRGILDDQAIVPLAGHRTVQYLDNLTRRRARTMDPEQLDPDSTRYWAISPPEMVEAILGVIDQPWGITISDLTVRATGDDWVY